jgi:hypothetical protein
MTSGVRTSPLPAKLRPARRALLCVPLLAFAALRLPGRAVAAEVAAAFDLDTLMALLARRKSGEARFTEERIVSGFDSPLRASGTLSYAAPDRFARQTLEPQRERMEVAGNQIRLERGGRTRVLTLDAVPELAALVEGLRGTLTGNGALLRKHFEVRLAGQARLWNLVLVPLDRQLAAQVRQLAIAGSGDELRSVEVQMAGGDRSLMLIVPVAAGAAAGAGSGAGTGASAGAGAASAVPSR